MRGNPSAHLIVSAFMMGLLTKKPDAKHAYDIVKRNNLKGGIIEMPPQVTPADIEFYNNNGWIPGNAGITVDICFQDWVIAQMAKKLKKENDYNFFKKRSQGWKNLFDPETKFLFPKNSVGKFLHTDPLSGEGWVESNSWQATFSIAHDLDGLAQLMGGKEAVTEKLNTAFTMAEPNNFISEYHSGYVAYSNQPCLANAHVFSYMGEPWLTQYWVRKVKEQAYGGTSPDLGYGGHDEDQGQMGGTSALMAIGLFNVYGNSIINPFYEITAPIFDEITIQLESKYYDGKTFIIKTYNNSEENCYIQKVRLNGHPVNDFRITHKEYTHGGILEIWLGDKPNKEWGVRKLNLTN
jgi:predicted alpha-1,2-mannosidase